MKLILLQDAHSVSDLESVKLALQRRADILVQNATNDKRIKYYFKIKLSYENKYIVYAIV
jgi:hypothetical protein